MVADLQVRADAMPQADADGVVDGEVVEEYAQQPALDEQEGE